MYRNFARKLLQIKGEKQNSALKLNSASCLVCLSRNVSSVKLCYNEFGEETGSPPVVIMHGLFGSKQNWRSISKALQAKTNPARQIITLDARNHGESPHSPEHSYDHLAADIADFLVERSIEKAIVMGHSMGGRAMMRLALTYPQLVDRAVIVDISPINTSRSFVGMATVFAAMKTIQVPSTLSMGDGRQLVKEHLAQSIPDSATIDFLLLNLRKSEEQGFYWIANVDALERNFTDTSTFSLNGSTFSGPVLFIAGKKSDFVKESDFPKIKTIFPNSQLRWLDTGHLVQLEKPYEFIDVVLNFINGN